MISGRVGFELDRVGSVQFDFLKMSGRVGYGSGRASFATSKCKLYS